MNPTSRLMVAAVLLLGPRVQAQVNCSQIWQASGQAQSGLVGKLSTMLTPAQMVKLAINKPKIEARILDHMLSILKADPALIVGQKNIRPEQIKDLSEAPTTSLEKDMLLFLASKEHEGTLDVYFKALFETALQKSGQTIPAEKKEILISTLLESMHSTLSLRGLSKDSKEVYIEWTEYSKTISQTVKDIQGKSVAERLEKAAESKILDAQEVRVLVDGKESFPLRDEMMSNAKESIDVMSWALYDDMTGTAAVDMLIAKAQAGIKVRVIVDGQVSVRKGYGDQLTRLENAGVPVIRWLNPNKKFEGQHRKMLIVDQNQIVAGGLNFGDVYSHKNPNSQKWRDTDVYLRGGKVAQESWQLFNKVWDSQIQLRNLKLPLSTTVKAIQGQTGNKSVMLIDSMPGQSLGGSPIMKTMLTAISEARHSIDVENAYVVLFPAMKEALISAAKSGVKVRVFTNSSKSVDEPVVSNPILRSSKELAENGVQVFLKNGETLHSKLFIVDQEISMVMSYNLHPRSERIEQEMAYLISDKEFGRKMTEVIDRDIQTLGSEVTSQNPITLPNDPSAILGLRIFFDQL